MKNENVEHKKIAEQSRVIESEHKFMKHDSQDDFLIESNDSFESASPNESYDGNMPSNSY